MTKNLKRTDGKSYLSAPKTSATMNIKGIDYLVESYYVGNKNIHDTIIRIAENAAYAEMYDDRKIKGSYVA